MQIKRTEEQWNIVFIDAYKLYRDIIENIYNKAIGKANNKTFAKSYFLEYLETELEFFNKSSFNQAIVNYFQVSYNLGLTWAMFFKEIRILKKIHTYNDSNANMDDYLKLCSEFTPQEVNRIVIESKLLKSDYQETSIYSVVSSTLLNKNREIDFVRYIAKYKSMCAFAHSLRSAKENNDENNKNTIKVSNDAIRWNGTKGKKIELIRLLVALNDCKYFETDKGLVPSQDQLMNYFGQVLSIKLNHYEQDLSNGFESKLQTNTALFDKLKRAIEKRFDQKVEQPA